LVESEEDLAPGLRRPAHLPDGVAPEYRHELARGRLVDEDVAIGEVEDARLAIPLTLARPQLPDDLEGDKGLPVPVARVSRRRRLPSSAACTARLIAVTW
jgi:hypothetical protein